MPWLLNLHPINHPRADDLFLVAGKINRLAVEFERKCNYVRDFGFQIRAIEAEKVNTFDDLIDAIPKATQLAKTLNDLAGLQIATENDSQILNAARKSRNALIHESLPFPLQINSPLNEESLRIILRQTRQTVRNLIEGEKLVGTWVFALTEGRDEYYPRAFLEGYVSSLDQWIFSSVWDLLSDGSTNIPRCESAMGNVIENYEWLPENLRPKMPKIER